MNSALRTPHSEIKKPGGREPNSGPEIGRQANSMNKSYLTEIQLISKP